MDRFKIIGGPHLLVPLGRSFAPVPERFTRYMEVIVSEANRLRVAEHPESKRLRQFAYLGVSRQT